MSEIEFAILYYSLAIPIACIGILAIVASLVFGFPLLGMSPPKAPKQPDIPRTPETKS